MADYDKALEDIRSAVDALAASSHSDAESVVEGLRHVSQAAPAADYTATMDGIAELLGYADLLLLVLIVFLVLFAGLFVGFIVTDRLR